MRRLHFPLLLAAFAFATPAEAQQRPATPSDEDIVVNGVRADDRQIEDFIEALTDVPQRGQISRFDFSKACPMASGLTPRQSATVVRRIRAVAASADIPLGEAGCRPNILVIVTDNKRRTVEEIAKRLPSTFEGFYPGQIKALARGPGPVAIWHVPLLLDPDGRPATMALQNPQEDPSSRVANTTSFNASRLSAGSRPSFGGAILVVEQSALVGLTTVQFADYAAMRTLADTDPERLGGSAAPTILKVLDVPVGGEAPLTLTHWDIGFLRSLYRARENRFINAQRGEMRRMMKQELEGAQDRR